MRLFTTPKCLYERLEREYEGREILEIGVGQRKLKGAVGIDQRTNALADIHHDLNLFPWPVRDNAFDLILCRHVLEHLRELDRVMEEVYRIGRPGSQVVLEVPHFSNVEAYRHWQHVHYFTAGSFDFFHPGNRQYQAHLKILFRRIFFDDLSRLFLIEFFANRFVRLYERRFAFLFPAGSIYMVLEVVK